MALIQCHECNGDVSTEATSCPHCGAPVRAPIKQKVAHPNYALRGFLVCLLLGCLAFLVIVKSAQRSARTPPSKRTAPALASESPHPPLAKNLVEAVSRVRSLFGDMRDQPNDATMLLAMWSADHLTWDQLRTLPMTNHDLVMRFPKGEVGKVVCAVGQVFEIYGHLVEGRRVWIGGILDEYGRVYRFVNVNSRGKINDHYVAITCGVVTGRIAYEDAGGGTTEGVMLMGMFDLPENHDPK